MSGQTVTLRITGENGQLVGVIRASRAQLDALGTTAAAAGQQAKRGADGVEQVGAAAERTGRRSRTAREGVVALGAGAEQAGQQAIRGARGVDQMGDAAERTRARASALSGTLGGLKGLLAGYVGIETIGGLGRMADAYTDILGKLRQVTNGEQELATARAATFRIAQETYQSLEATTTLYARGAAALAQYGTSQATVARLTHTINQGLLVSRASTAESASAILQLSQALGAGALRGEEFNAVNEAAPRLMQALAQSIGVPRGELKKLAEEGKLTVDVLLQAWTGAEAAKIAEEAQKVPLTMARAWQRTRNDILQYVGEINEATGIGAAVAGGIALVGDNLKTIAAIATLAGVAVGVRLVAHLVTAGRAFVANAAAARITQLGLVSLQGETVRLTAAQTASAVASRAMGSAIALMGGPIGVAIAALAGLVMWSVSSASEASAAAEQIASSFRTAKAALDDFNEAPTAQRFEGVASAEVEKSVQEAKAALVDLREAAEDAQATYSRAIARFGFAGEGLMQRVSEANEAYEAQRLRVDALSASYDEAVGNVANIIQEMSGVKQITPEAAAETRKFAEAVLRSGLDLDTLRPKILEHIEKQYGVEASGYAAAQGIGALRKELQESNKDFEQAQGRIDSLVVRLAGLRDGKPAEIRVSVGQRINTRALELGKGDRDAGIAAMRASGELRQYGELLRQELQVSAQVEQAQESQATARKGAAAATREQTRALREHTRDENLAERATRALNDLIRDQQNVYAGPAKQAANDYADALDRIKRVEDDLVKAKRLDAEAQGQLGIAREEAAKAYARNAAIAEREEQALARRTDVVGQAVQAYEDETRATAANGREHAVQEALLRAEAEARELYTKGLRASIDLTREEAAAIREGIEAGYVRRETAEAASAAAEEYQRSWINAVGSVSDAFGDWVTGGIKSFKDFGRTLKDIAKRFIADLIAQFTRNSLAPAIGNWFQQLTNGFAQAGGGGGGGGFWGTIGNMARSYFGGGGQSGAAAASMGGFGSGATGVWNAYGAGTSYGMPSYAAGNVPVGAVGHVGGGSGGFGGSGLSGMNMLTGEFAGGMPYASAGLGLAGLYYGATQRGNGGFSSAAAGLSYGALGVGVGGAIAGGLGALGTAAGVGGMTAGAVAGSTGAMASLGAAAWIPVVGWILAALAAIDMISGGKLFGTKFKPTGSSVDLNLGPDGASGAQTIHEVRNRSLFRGRQWRDRTQALSPEALEALDDVFKQMGDAIEGAARDLGVEVPDMVVASFRMEYDKNGKLTREWGTINGRRYDEDQETFFQRLSLENMLQVAKQVGGAAEIETLADGYRASVETLQDFASLMLAVQGDIKNSRQIWSASGEGVLTTVVEMVERLGRGSESLVETYARLTQTAGQYGELIGGVDQEIRMRGLNDYQRAQLQVELGYRQQVKQANELARALGLSGARAEDLARIEQLRALDMAELQRRQEAERNRFVEDLSLSDLSTLRDDQKLSESMQLLRDAVSSGDLQRAQQLSQTVLGLGRNLYASGADYSGLYDEVTGLLRGMTAAGEDGFSETELTEIADILTGLPRQFATALFDLLYAQQAAIGTTPPAPPAPPPAAPPGGASGGGGAPTGEGGAWRNVDTVTQQLARANQNLELLVDASNEAARTQRGSALDRLNAKVPL